MLRDHKINDETIDLEMMVVVAGMTMTAICSWFVLDAMTKSQLGVITLAVSIWAAIMSGAIWLLFPPQVYIWSAVFLGGYYLFH